MKTETNDKLSLLDCTVTRVTNNFETSTYRKDTFSVPGMGYFSFTYLFEIGSVKTLHYRAIQFVPHNLFRFLKDYFVRKCTLKSP